MTNTDTETQAGQENTTPAPEDQNQDHQVEGQEGQGEDGGEQQTTEQRRMVPLELMTRELTPLRSKLRESEAALTEHRRQIQEYQELIKQLRGGQQGQGDPGQQTRTQQPAPQVDAEIERRAAQLAFERDTKRISATGINAFGAEAWLNTCGVMDSLGLNSPDFIATIMDVAGTDQTHHVFAAIAKDPERASELAGMTPLRRAAEISRITDQMAKGTQTGTQTTQTQTGSQGALGAKGAPGRTVSRTPPPAPRINSGNSTTKNFWDDNVTDEEFSRGWEDHMKSRTGMRR